MRPALPLPGPQRRSRRYFLSVAPWRTVVLLWLLPAAATRSLAQDFVPPSVAPEALRPAYDIVIAGAGTGGSGAAIQAARLGASVLILEETDWIGGQMLAAAVTAIDEGGAGNLVRQRGLYHEFVQRVQAVYAPLRLDPFKIGHYINTRFEPKVGRTVLHAMLTDAARHGVLDLALRSRVVNVQRDGAKITGVEVELVGPHGRMSRRIACHVLVDATEWGDVLPLTGARYRAGNHTNDALDLQRSIQENTWTAVIKAYPSGAPADLRIAAPPPGYAERHAAFAKVIVPGDAPQRRGTPMSWSAFVDYRGMPDSTRPGPTATTTRTHLNFSNDYPCTVAYLEDPAQRTATHRAMRLRTLQLLHYVQNVLGMANWSVADDEGFDSPYNRAEIDAWLRERPDLAPYRKILYHFSVVPYVRESRRLVGLHTLTAREISRGPGKRPTPFPTAIALGDYRLDLHGGRGPADLELDLDRREDLEDAQPGRAGPFAIPFESLIPELFDGLLAAEKNFSQTRLVNGATRMQPHTLNIGQAVGALAALAVRHGVPPRRIDPVLVQRAVLAGGSTLNLTPLSDVGRADSDWAAVQLVTVHGLLPLDSGRFAPQQPLDRTTWTAALAKIGAAAPLSPAAPSALTRAEFAQSLTDAAARAVKINFVASAADAALPITRSEAAQVLAEFLELRALARLRNQPATLAWDSVKSATRTVTEQDLPPATRHIRRLVAANVIARAEAAYWDEHAVISRECDGARVAALLLGSARLFDPTATPATFLDVLVREKIISSRDYWAKNAITGGSCSGKNVATVIRNLAERTAAAR